MKIEQLKENVEIIQTLSDYPNTDQGLTPAELKKKFDDGNRIIKEYLNSTVVPAINQNGEKIQKREPLEVSIGVASASHTAGEILAARAAGRDVYGYLTGPEVEDTRLSLLSVTADCAIFSRFHDDHSWEKYLIDRGGAVEYYHERYALEDRVIKLEKTIPTLADNAAQAAKSATQAAEDAAKAGKALIVTSKAEVVNQVGRIVASHNSNQIYEHISNGGSAYFFENGQYIPYNYSTTYNGLRTVVFAYFDFLGFGTFYSVKGDGELHTAYMHAATQEEVIASEKSIIDRLCPTFSESGVAVRCEPVEDYPLKVTTLLSDATDSLTLTLCGKNLFDCEKYKFTSGSISAGGGAASSSSNFSRINEYIPVDHLQGQTISLNHPASEKTATTNMGLAFYDASKVYISGSAASAIVVPDTAKYMRFCVPKEYEDGTQVQLELGAVVTEFESYRERVYTVTFEVPLAAGENYAWSDIEAIAGVNTIWSSVGTTSVQGKADPMAIINNLSEQIDALSKTVATLLEG